MSQYPGARVADALGATSSVVKTRLPILVYASSNATAAAQALTAIYTSFNNTQVYALLKSDRQKSRRSYSPGAEARTGSEIPHISEVGSCYV